MGLIELEPRLWKTNWNLLKCILGIPPSLTLCHIQEFPTFGTSDLDTVVFVN